MKLNYDKIKVMINKFLSSLLVDSKCQTLCRPVFVRWRNRGHHDLFGKKKQLPTSLCAFDAKHAQSDSSINERFQLMDRCITHQIFKYHTDSERLKGLTLADILQPTRNAKLSRWAPSCMNTQLSTWIIHPRINQTHPHVHTDIFALTNWAPRRSGVGGAEPTSPVTISALDQEGYTQGARHQLEDLVLVGCI